MVLQVRIGSADRPCIFCGDPKRVTWVGSRLEFQIDNVRLRIVPGVWLPRLRTMTIPVDATAVPAVIQLHSGRGFQFLSQRGPGIIRPRDEWDEFTPPLPAIAEPVC